MLNVRYREEGVVEIVCDREGLSLLVDKLVRLGGNEGPEHEHFMTPSWAGWELTEENLDPAAELVNHLAVYFVP